MNTTIQKNNRILSIDIMRGLTLFLMLFVNDLFEPGVPGWLLHAKANMDGMGLADWVFPGFLFMVGMAIPYAINSRLQKGESKSSIFGHILLRTMSLLIIGIFMLNTDRLNSNLSGINLNLWAVLMYVSVFLIWNKYPENEKMKKLFWSFKTLGVLGLIILAIIFRAGKPENISWFETSWWGILGLIGWGYLVASTVYLFLGKKIITVIAVWLGFVVLNMFSQWGLLGSLNFIKPIFGVIIDGNVPSIVLAGLVITLILKNSTLTPWRLGGTIFMLGLISLGIGFFLRNWFIISKIHGTPSWAMICNGISMIVFSLMYLLVDIKGKYKWAAVFRLAGQNSLTSYLAPDVIYFISWGLSLPLFFYKQETTQLFAVCGSICWAFAMILFTAFLSKINIRLKL